MTASQSTNPLESDAFWDWYGEFGFSEDVWELAPQEIDQVLSLAQPQDGARVLDLACGSGRHSIELSRRGYRVTGVDRQSGYIEDARRRATDAGLDVEFVVDDMRTFSRPDAFELVINLGSSFQYFDDEADYERVVGNVYSSLKPDGRLIMAMSGREPIAMRYRPVGVVRHSDGTVIFIETHILDNWQRFESTWTRITDGVVSTENIRMRLWGAVDLTALLRSCGFDSVDVFGDLERTAYDDTARHLIVVARK